MSVHGLASVAEVTKLIEAGKTLLLAGDEALLSQLPSGKWIGGTSANFMAESGGTTDVANIFYTDISEHAAKVEIRTYDAQELRAIGQGYPTNGFTVLIVPGLSEIHGTFAREVQGYDGVFNGALVGWVAGVHVSEIGKRAPKAFAGASTAMDNKAAVMYVTLPQGYDARLDIINLFAQGTGATIEFDVDGFSSEGTNCRIDGKPANLAAYVAENNLDTKLPLVADYNGAMINVSFQSVDAEKGVVNFYAPVFRNIKYRLASPVSDYTGQFSQVLSKSNVGEVAFSCNCILNYLYAELEGKKTAPLVGPITFGEIAYMLLNQTLVYLSIEKID